MPTIRIRHLNSRPVSQQPDNILRDRHNSLRTAILAKLAILPDKRYINHLYALLEAERELTLRENQINN